jgi:hypothetical protein
VHRQVALRGAVPRLSMQSLPPGVATAPTMAWPPEWTCTCSTVTFCLPFPCLVTPPRCIVAAKPHRISSQRPATSSTHVQSRVPRMTAEASAVANSTITDISTNPRMTRAIVMMFKGNTRSADAF